MAADIYVAVAAAPERRKRTASAAHGSHAHTYLKYNSSKILPKPLSSR